MIVLTVQWLASIGEEDKVKELFQKLAEASRKEPGCRLYLVHQHRDNRRRFFLYEQYENDAALQAHRESPHFQTFGMQELPEIAKRIEGELYNLV
ncbi:MAG TPA: putative quinol monooxygenase [Terriglobales bacterium]|nr:putative quinol monooxygenase [Terriglobales bacterium]